MRIHRMVSSLGSALWFIPVLCVLAGGLLSFSTIWVDTWFDFHLIPQSLTGGPDAAIAILATVATSMVSLAALVLTITMVVVQLAMGQFSPRIVQTFLRDKPSQLAVGLFIATFVHALLAMREVHFQNGGSVPGLTLVVAYLLVVVSVVVLVLYVHHIGRSLRVSSLIELVGADIRDLVDDVYPEALEALPPMDGVVIAPRSGVVTAISHDRLVACAEQVDCTIRMVPALGAFVPAGAPLFRVEGDMEGLDIDELTDAVLLGLERTLEQDVAYGLRLLVDMAERALADSPFLDPTTAVQAIDRLHDCLRQISRRVLPNGVYEDSSGQARLIVPVMDWDAFVHLAFDEIRQAGAASPQVSRRILAALDDLETVVPSERLAALRHQRELMQASVQQVVEENRDVTFALAADRQGIGMNARTQPSR